MVLMKLLEIVIHNNCLICMELIFEFDPFHHNIRTMVNEKLHLSFDTYHEIIKIMGKTVVEEIVTQIAAAKC